MTPDDNVKVFAYTKDNSFSEGNKMKYWMVPKDADGDGHLTVRVITLPTTYGPISLSTKTLKVLCLKV